MVMVEIMGNRMKVTKYYEISDDEIKLLKLIGRPTNEITKEMYGSLKYKQRVHQMVYRLKKKGVQIESRKGIGYRLNEEITMC